MNILNEDATTNLCTNPSAETTVADIVRTAPMPPAPATSTIERSNEQAWVGNYSIKFSNTASTVEAYRVGAPTPSGVGQTFTASAWMFIQSGSFRIRVGFRDSGGNVVGGQSGAYTSAAAGWVRLSTTATSPVNTANVEIVIGTNAAGVAYIDALQLEEKPSATSYADGSLGFGYAWTGTLHNSSSTRAAGVLAADGSITARDIDSFGSVTATGSIKPGSFTRSRLPAPGNEGRLANLLDDQRALYRDSGTKWYPINRGIMDVRDFGAYCNAKVNFGVTVTAGSKVVTRGGTGGFDFTADDVGKTIIVHGNTEPVANFIGVIASFQSAAQVTLIANAPYSQGNSYIIYGNDDTAAIQEAIDATKKIHPEGVRGLFTGNVFLPNASIISNTLLFQDKSILFYGNGWGTLMHDNGNPIPQPGSGLIWAGVAGLPMIHVKDSLNTRLSDFRLYGNKSAKPIGIRCEMSGEANCTHINAYGTIERIWIGKMFVSAEPDSSSRTFAIAIQGYVPTVLVNGIPTPVAGNTDFYKLNTILVRGADVGYSSNNNNITYWDWQTLLMQECGVGFIAAGDIHGRGWFFANNDLDIQIGDTSAGMPVQARNSRMVLDHFGSEGSKKFITWKGDGSVVINKGSWQAYGARADADGIVIRADVASTVELTINNFQFNTDGETAADYQHKIKLGVDGNLRTWRVRLNNVKGITPESFIIPTPTFNDGRTSGFIEFDMIPYAFPGITSKAYVHYDPEEVEKPHNRFDFNGRVLVRGGALLVKRLRTSGIFYKFPVGVAALGGGSGTNYEYLVSAMSGTGESLGTQVITTTNGALGGAIKNRIEWFMISGATAFRVYGRAVGQRKRLVTLNAWNIPQGSSGQFYWDDDGTVAASTDDVPTADSTGRVIAEGGVVSERAFIEGMNTVPFSATPVFDAALGNTQKMTLTGNVTSSTLINPPDAGQSQQLTLIIAQDATGGRTFAYPANIKGGMVVGSAANAVSVQTFRYDGGNWRAETPGVVT